MIKLWNFLSGKKTYVVGILAVAYGIIYKDPNAVIIGLTAMGLRNGLAVGISQLLNK
jgi:hypothetical protein